jgi:cytochrome c oxidase accessory protein FixG
MRASIDPSSDVSPEADEQKKPEGRIKPNLDSVTTIRDDGSRRFIHPANVKGTFTRWRTVAGVILTAVYVLLPWIQIKGNPAVFLDVANRQFHFFGLHFVAQDLWLGFFLITGLGFSLFYVTSVLGRIWCGWACPQTVFLDIIRRIERWIEGDAPRRRQLDSEPSSPSKIVKRIAKHTFFAVFALALAHVFLSYFVSLPQVYSMMSHSPGENWGAFVFVFLMSAALWFDFAWFREQFCIVLCPYGRLQSALVDSDTMVIGYDTKRGEPRGKKGTIGAGDCIDCSRCVQVCPTGIDIRHGLQIECIGCAACIDACDDVMNKVDRPKGLIRYDSQRGFTGQATRWIRPRTLMYTGLLMLGATVMTFALSTLSAASLGVTRMVGAPYFVEDGHVRNQFLIRILNKHQHVDTFNITFKDAPPGTLISGVENGVEVGPLGESLTPLVITVPRSELKGERPITVMVEARDGKANLSKTITLIGPDL